MRMLQVAAGQTKSDSYCQLPPPSCQVLARRRLVQLPAVKVRLLGVLVRLPVLVILPVLLAMLLPKHLPGKLVMLLPKR